MQATRKQTSLRHTRWFATCVTTALLLIWGTGLADAIIGGLNPGYVYHPDKRPYPLGAVVFTGCVISAEAGLLVAILRPFSLFRPRRALIALSVFGPVWLADVVTDLATDLPGYSYSNGVFLSYAMVFLFVVATILVCRSRDQVTVGTIPKR